MRMLILLSLAIGLYCCNTKEDIGSPLYCFDIDPEEAGKTKFTDLFCDFEEVFIAPSTKIGSINKLIINHDTLILFDGMQQQVIILKSSGEVLTTIKKRGKGPGEYSRLADISFFEEQNQINALDYNSRKILVYNINGDFINSYNIDVTAFSIETDLLGNNYLYTAGMTHLLDTTTTYNLVKTNRYGKIIDLCFPFDNPMDKAIAKSAFLKYDNEIFFNYGIHDSVFMISNDKPAPFLAIKILGTIPFSKIYEDPKYEMNNQQALTLHGFIGRVLISNRFIIFNYAKSGSIYMHYYDRFSKKSKSIKLLEDDYYHSTTYFPIYIDGDLLFFIIHPTDIENKSILAKHGIDSDNISLQNPFIIKCRIKGF